MEALETLDLSLYADTALGLETGLSDDSECWASVAAAGLQFYGYDGPDGLDGRVMPAPGDRLGLVRAPDNPADANAVEIWWRNEHMLGHLPRGVAAELAPRLDGGEPVRAYCADPGTGEAWSLVVLLVGRGVEALHRQRLERLTNTRAWEERLELLDAEEAVWGRERMLPDPDVPWGRVTTTTIPEPTTAQFMAAQRFWEGRRRVQTERRAAAVYAFHMIPKERPALPAGPVDEALRGRVFGWWDEVPATLKTKTQWAEAGRKLAKGAAPFAAVEYGRGRRYRRHDLYAVSDTVAMREASPQAVAAAAEAAFRSGRLRVW
ncbi:HIRAN domain-containing protein [Azospirillum sp. Sh1]|uniref:HIRAN domain-containing protein n=1 Tax=Azospirillum sp. Sh1 TaxID=2607285 RepID=UPI00165E11FF|nr:HIRAN domain-containing protein [Azospirillum sp. Sh1]